MRHFYYRRAVWGWIFIFPWLNLSRFPLRSIGKARRIKSRSWHSRRLIWTTISCSVIRPVIGGSMRNCLSWMGTVVSNLRMNHRTGELVFGQYFLREPQRLTEVGELPTPIGSLKLFRWPRHSVWSMAKRSSLREWLFVKLFRTGRTGCRA